MQHDEREKPMNKGALLPCPFQVGDSVTVHHPEYGDEWPGEHTVTGVEWQYQRGGRFNIFIASDDDIRTKCGPTDGWHLEHLRLASRALPPAPAPAGVTEERVYEIALHGLNVAAPGVVAHLREHAARTIAKRVAALSLPSQAGWLPIESARKDGRRALVYRPLARMTHDEPVAIKRLIDGDYHCWPATVPPGETPCNPTDGACHVTHWQPLPAHPASKGRVSDMAKRKPKPKRPPFCSQCGTHRSDPPSKLCPGCEAYLDHTK